MRIDLRLVVFELRVLEQVFHGQLPLLHPNLHLHALTDPPDIVVDAGDHLVKCHRHGAHLISALRLLQGDAEIPAPHLFCLSRQLFQGPGKGPDHTVQQRHQAAGDAYQHRDHKHFQIPQIPVQHVVIFRIGLESQVVQPAYVCLKIRVQLLNLLIACLVGGHVMPLFCLYGLVGQLQPGKGKAADIALHAPGRMVGDGIVNLLYHRLKHVPVAFKRLQSLLALNIQILIHIALQLRQKPLQLSQADIRGVHLIHIFYNGIDTAKQKKINPKGNRHGDNDRKDQLGAQRLVRKILTFPKPMFLHPEPPFCTPQPGTGPPASCPPPYSS